MPAPEAQPYDLVVIGGGINGTGIARDAAMRGLRVALVEKSDLGGETTAWSTRLIHGGLRYLEHGELGLVRESLRERESLLGCAGHLVQPLHFLLPIYQGARRGRMLIRIGLTLYDLLVCDSRPGRHRFLSRAETLRQAPGLEPRGLRCAATYRDAQVTFPERLALENALAARQHGASILTYCRAERLLTDGGSVEGVEYTDVATGARHRLQARVVVNATGPWVDQMLGQAGWSGPKLLGITKGSHIVVDPFPGAPRHALYLEAQRDGRPFFILPWNGRRLVGTTDVRRDAPDGPLSASDEEIDYLVSETNRVIPGARLTGASVLYSYAGLRPLPSQPGHSEGAITRRHIIRGHAPQIRRLLSVTGGKITTYRNLSEQVVDRVFRELGRPVPECRTADTPLPGHPEGSVEETARGFAALAGLSPGAALRLATIYGRRGAALLDLAASTPALAGEIEPGTGILKAEIVFGLVEEMAHTLTDVLMRRTMAGLEPDMGRGCAAAAARVVADYLGWDRSRVLCELDGYGRFLARFRPRGAGTPSR